MGTARARLKPQNFEISRVDDCFKTVAQIYKTVYKNDDMGFEQLQHLFNLHQGIAEYEAINNGNESIIKYHLERAFECCKKSMDVKAHNLIHPMLYSWRVSDAPSDRKINMRYLSERLKQNVYESYHQTDWFIKIDSDTAKLLKE